MVYIDYFYIECDIKSDNMSSKHSHQQWAFKMSNNGSYNGSSKTISDLPKTFLWCEDCNTIGVHMFSVVAGEGCIDWT